MFSNITNASTASRFSTYWAFLSTLVFFLILLFFNFSPSGEQQFSYLADSFLHGKLYFLQEPGSWIDTSPYGGNHYWPIGPLPALIIVPFVFIFSLFGKFFAQGYIQPFLVAAVFYIIYRFGRRLNYSPGDSTFWAFGFTFASVFLNVALRPWSWWYAQVLTVLLLWSGLWEYFNKKRYWLLGAITGALLLTRLPASLIVILFMLDIVFPQSATTYREKITRFINFTLPVFICLLLTVFYNYLRFDNFFETGYSLQILIDESLTAARDYSLISLVHLPGNIYYHFLSMPLPLFNDEISHVLKFPFITANPWGMSIFVTSPYFLLLFLFKYKDRESKLMLFAALSISIPILLYYGIGYRQFGYRYSLDYLPLLFLLLMKKYREVNDNLSIKFKILLITTACFNLFFFMNLFMNP